MRTIIFATSNSNKIAEAQLSHQGQFRIAGLDEIGCREDIPETRSTIEGNALQKAEYVFEHYQVDCFAEDTGLEVEALDGAPGVYSARYAGPQRNAEDNMNLLLANLGNQQNRNARFKTVVALILDGKTYTFEGIVNGRIAAHRTGSGGFGYDPIFIPDGFERSFAEMTTAEKNQISHRGIAIQKLKNFLNQYK